MKLGEIPPSEIGWHWHLDIGLHLGVPARQQEHHAKIFKARTRYNYTLAVWMLEIARSRKVYRV
jgi:hypothetical protein